MASGIYYSTQTVWSTISVSESELRVEVLDAFLALTQAITNLCIAVKMESHLVSWVQDSDLPLFPTDKPLSAREKSTVVISQLQYTQNQAPREIIVCAGFIGASPSTINLATVVNECKDRFKKSILALKSAKIPTRDPFLTDKMNSILSRAHITTKTLQKVGLARLHLKQCYRKIPILNGAPQKISWTWAHTRSIKKISISQAQELLFKKGDDPGIQIQLQKLSCLHPHESLAIVQELAPHLRANILYPQEAGAGRVMIKGPIPIFFPCESTNPMPEFNPPSKKREKNIHRLKRSDIKLEPTPYLSAIHAHRYSQD